MVLVRVFWAVLLAGCIKAGPPVQAPSSVDVLTTVTLGTVDKAHGQALPTDLPNMLRDVLSARRLNLQQVAAPSDFNQRQSTAHRMAWLTSNNGSAPILLLIELQARRYDTMGGRFRWVVEVDMTLAAQSDPSAAQTSEFSVPVHLRYAHNDATDAVAASLPTIRRHLAAAIDSHLSGAAAL